MLLESYGDCAATSDNVRQVIDNYYDSIMPSIKSASVSTLPSKKVTSHYDQYITPGQNDLVQKYAAAHEAFMDWNFA